MRSSPRAPRPSTYGTHNRSFHRLHSSVTPYSLLLLSVANHVPLSELRYSSLFSSSEPSSSSKWGSMEPRPACQTKRRPLMNHAMHGLISKDAPHLLSCASLLVQPKTVGKDSSESCMQSRSLRQNQILIEEWWLMSILKPRLSITTCRIWKAMQPKLLLRCWFATSLAIYYLMAFDGPPDSKEVLFLWGELEYGGGWWWFA